MDLEAFANIEKMEKLLTINNINVPRLRGIRLMSDEKKIDIDEYTKGLLSLEYLNMVDSVPRFSYRPVCYVLNQKTKRLERKYIVFDKDGIPIDLRWDKIHGTNRKNAKFYIKRVKKSVKKQVDTFNKYVGADDVLYIHARIGGGNWNYYKSEVIDKPWFIERIDDSFDSTYCDIYARIKEGL